MLKKKQDQQANLQPHKQLGHQCKVKIRYHPSQAQQKYQDFDNHIDLKDCLSILNNLLQPASTINNIEITKKHIKIECYQENSIKFQICVYFQPIRQSHSSKIHSINAVICLQSQNSENLSGEGQSLILRYKGVSKKRIMIPLQVYSEANSYNFQLIRQKAQTPPIAQIQLLIPICFYLEPRFEDMLRKQDTSQNSQNGKPFSTFFQKLKLKTAITQYSFIQVKKQRGYQLLKTFLAEKNWFSAKGYDELFFVKLGEIAQSQGENEQTSTFTLEVGSKTQSRLVDILAQFLIEVLSLQ